MTLRITIGASDVAACIGSNPYKTPKEVMDQLLSKYFPSKGVKTDEEKAKELCTSNPLTTDLLDSIKKDSGTIDSTIITNRVNQVLKKLDLSGEDKKVITNFLHSKANTTHGIRREDKTAQHMIDSGIYTNLVKDNRFHKYTILETDIIHFSLVGRVDRLDIDKDGNTTLIEIKNRTKKLFGTMKEYEHIQVQSYLHLLDLENAKLIEQYKEDMNIFPITRDKNLWDTFILPNLIEFCNMVVKESQ